MRLALAIGLIVIFALILFTAALKPDPSATLQVGGASASGGGGGVRPRVQTSPVSAGDRLKAFEGLRRHVEAAGISAKIKIFGNNLHIAAADDDDVSRVLECLCSSGQAAKYLSDGRLYIIRINTSSGVKAMRSVGKDGCCGGGR
jgi:hypothetical protein